MTLGELRDFVAQTQDADASAQVKAHVSFSGWLRMLELTVDDGPRSVGPVGPPAWPNETRREPDVDRTLPPADPTQPGVG